MLTRLTNVDDILWILLWFYVLFLHESLSEKWSRSVVSDSATPWTVAYQAPPSMGFSRQEYWSGLPFPSSGDLPDPGIEPRSPALQADTLPSEPPGKPTKALCTYIKGSDYISLSSLSGSWAPCVSAVISTFSLLIYSPFSATNNPNNPVSSASCASFPHFIICLPSLLYHGLVTDSCSTWWLPLHPRKHFS